MLGTLKVTAVTARRRLAISKNYLKARFNDLIISSSRVPKLGPFLISLPSIVQLQSLWVGQKSRLGPLKIYMPLKVSEWLPDDCPPYVSNSML